MEVVDDIDKDPALHPLPYDPLRPVLIDLRDSLWDMEMADDEGDLAPPGSEECHAGRRGHLDDEESADEEEDSQETPDSGSDVSDSLRKDYSWEARQPPSIAAASAALADVKCMLKPLRSRGGGYKECRLPLQLRT